jgi:hypothetical protein
MKSLSLCVLGALVCSCHATIGFPDRRDADIVVDRDLRESTEQAIAWWKEATQGQVDFQIVDKCNQGRSCITVELAALGPDMGGNALEWKTLHGERGNTIKVDVLVAYDADTSVTRHVIAHELGHALGFDHVYRDKLDAMRPRGYGASCLMRPGMQRQWRAMYGNVNVVMVCDRLQIDGLAGYNR